MARRGRPIKYKDIEEFRKAMAERQREYYKENREIVLAKAKRKRRLKREQQQQQKQNENRGEMM